jgi:MFS family permease
MRHNLVANLLDGAFFGLGIGFASFVTVIPLFVSELTNSAMLIGLIPAIHGMGWQLPQLFTANRVSRQRRYKPMVMMLTLHERLPFLGLAFVAWSLSRLEDQTALLLVFGLLVWQGLGGGFAATAWQSMIGKIFPANRRGTFYGTQAAVANLLASLGAVLAGYILNRMEVSAGFGLCFFIAAGALAISYIALAQTREPEHVPAPIASDSHGFWNGLGVILRGDFNFRWFLVGRVFSQFATMAGAFFTVYAVSQLKVSELEAGWMTGLYMGTQIVVNPLMGWLGDHWSNRGGIEIGLIAATLSALLAWWAPGPAWFYLVFILAGVAGVGIWTLSLSMILEFGSEVQRPAYIGLGNTLVAPANILAPLLGGWLADIAGYQATFLVSALGGLAALVVFHILVRDPRKLGAAEPVEA